MAQNITYPSSNPKLDEFVPSFSDQEIVEIIDGFEDPGRADSALMTKLYTTTQTTQYPIHNVQNTTTSIHNVQNTTKSIHNTQCITMHILQVVTTQSHDNTQCTKYNTQHC